MDAEKLIKAGREKFGAAFGDIANWVADQIVTSCDAGEAIDTLIYLSEKL